MKRFFLVLSLLGSILVNGQTVDEVIQKYTAAMGGLETFNKIQTLKMTGNVTAQGMEMALTVQVVNGKSLRTDVVVNGQSIINVYDNGKGWKINPFAGAPTATEVTGEEFNDFKAQSMLASQLMDYKARGHKVELSGQEDIEGIKAYKIILTAKEDGRTSTYYINTTDFTPIKQISKRTMQGQEYDVETYFSDFKDFSGIKVSMTRIQKVEGQVIQELHFSNVELNIPIDQKTFAQP
jgi:hypothetical protein